MARPKKEGKHLNVFLDKTLHEELDLFCEEQGQTKTIVVERALRMYMSSKKENALVVAESGGGKAYYFQDDARPHVDDSKMHSLCFQGAKE